MCAVSNVGDWYTQRWPQVPVPAPPSPGGMGSGGALIIGPTRYEFDQLKKEVEEMKRLLLMAKEIDEKTGKTNCEMEEKVKMLQKVAEMVGVDLKEVFGK